MNDVAITCMNGQDGHRYAQALEGHATTRLITPEDCTSPAETLLDGVGGLLLSGMADLNPSMYREGPNPGAGLELCRDLDTLERGVLQTALDRDMPVLAICRGMHLLNVAFGGTLLQHVSGHTTELEDGSRDPVQHSIYLSPGSKLAAILGMGGFFRVNSLHHQGLRDAQRSPRLLASAYSVEDAIVEGLESPDHSWVIGVQCHPELSEQMPKVFANLFVAFAERAKGFGRDSEDHEGMPGAS